MRTAVVDACRRLARAGLLIGTAGNVSLRTGELVAITATGTVLGEVTAHDVVLVDLDGRLVEGDLRPTSELALHLSVYAATGAGAVVHTHAPAATAVGVVLDELPVLHYQQLLLGGAIRVAPFHAFGTPELAAAVTSALEGRTAALMANHGSVSYGGSLAEAVDRAELLEWLCRLHLDASALGSPRPLTDAQQQAVIEQAIARDYGTKQEPS